MKGYTNVELAEMHLLYGEVRGNASEAARLYAERYPNRKKPNGADCIFTFHEYNFGIDFFRNAHRHFKLYKVYSLKDCFIRDNYFNSCIIIVRINLVHNTQSKHGNFFKPAIRNLVINM
ncbi:hypothetical protein PUN28_010846 [Cardiocondyla obscurior]|uniref:DUF4817 domain-containing protein n=1 Tax=Cardiocondyla obscurior TaxID=286306 RepID=A0AAW2FK28_9HYME